MQLIESAQVITAAFSDKVKDTIRIRQQQLVAVNTSTEPAEISWRWFIGEVESAAAQFCRERRRQGDTPEQVLKDAKRVIHAAIDGEDVPIAERAVLSCIQHYYHAD